MQFVKVLVLLAVTCSSYGAPAVKTLHVTTPILASELAEKIRHMLETEDVAASNLQATSTKKLTYPEELQGATSRISSSPSKSRVKKGDAPNSRTITKAYVIPNYESGFAVPPTVVTHGYSQASQQLGQEFEHDIEEEDVHQYEDDKRYNFVYRVLDNQYKTELNEHGQEVVATVIPNDYGHSEAKDGKKTVGRYFVKLPDGRVQTVRYWADDSGYHANVLFLGEAQHPKVFNQYQQLGSSTSLSNTNLGSQLFDLYNQKTNDKQYKAEHKRTVTKVHKHIYIPAYARNAPNAGVSLQQNHLPSYEAFRGEKPSEMQGTSSYDQEEKPTQVEDVTEKSTMSKN